MPSFKDIGALQRREAADGSPVSGESYTDIGAIQREEATALATTLPRPDRPINPAFVPPAAVAY